MSRESIFGQIFRGTKQLLGILPRRDSLGISDGDLRHVWGFSRSENDSILQLGVFRIPLETRELRAKSARGRTIDQILRLQLVHFLFGGTGENIHRRPRLDLFLQLTRSPKREGNLRPRPPRVNIAKLTKSFLEAEGSGCPPRWSDSGRTLRGAGPFELTAQPRVLPCIVGDTFANSLSR